MDRSTRRRMVRDRLALVLVLVVIAMQPSAVLAQTPAVGFDNAVAITTSACHSLALRADGTVWGWGCNSEWDLGATAPNGASSTATPIPATDLDQVRAIAFGNGHGLAVRADGTVWAWGANDYGQIGVATEDCPMHHLPCSQVPVSVPGLHDITAVAATDRSSFALHADGTVWAWGRGALGELGPGSRDDRHEPMLVDGLSDVVMLSGAGTSVLALRSDGTVWTWGGSPEQGTPVPVPGLADVTEIAAGSLRHLALTSGGTVWTWAPGAHPTPIPVAGLGPMTGIAAGMFTFAALAPDGTVWTWIWDVRQDAPKDPPAAIADLETVRAISKGSDDDLVVLKADGTVWMQQGMRPLQQVPAPA